MMHETEDFSKLCLVPLPFVLERRFYGKNSKCFKRYLYLKYCNWLQRFAPDTHTFIDSFYSSHTKRMKSCCVKFSISKKLKIFHTNSLKRLLLLLK